MTDTGQFMGFKNVWCPRKKGCCLGNHSISLGVTIDEDLFIVGSRAVATCTSIGDPADISSISWINGTGDVLISAPSQTLLELVFDPVTDDQSLDGTELTCQVVTVGGEISTQAFQVVLIGEESCPEPLPQKNKDLVIALI